jgi:zinc/manganese transport system substrate-binding protein
MVPVSAADPDPAEQASVVVTTEVLGAVVGELVGDAADVSVLMERGANPHAWEPSARDTERLLAADLVISNGLDLEEGLLPVLEAAAAEGVPMFEAGDHLGLGGGSDDGEADDGHDHDGVVDPHLWTDPLLMRDVVLALESVLAEVGVDVGAGAADLAERLEALDAEVRDLLAPIPQEDRRLVTGHVSLGYFADRYGFEVLGTVIPGLTTQGEPSARELARLIADVKETGVSAIFAEVGTPQSVAEAVAQDGGAEVVRLQVANLPEDGSYFTLIRDIARTVADALGGGHGG